MNKFFLQKDAIVFVNQVWFDDMILPGETQLRLVSNVDEVDDDLIYNIDEIIGDVTVTQPLADTSLNISTVNPGQYLLQSSDWQALIRVDLVDYPAFQEINRPNAATSWSLYE